MPSTVPKPRRLRAALLAVLLALAVAALAAAPASASQVTDVTANYGENQTSRGAGGVSEYLHVRFRTTEALAAGQTMTLRGPAGGDLSGSTYQLNVGIDGFAVHRATLSDANGTVTLFVPPAAGMIPAGAWVRVSATNVRNPNAPGRYRWWVSTTTDTTPASSPEYEIAAGPIARLSTTGSWSLGIPAAAEQADAVEVRTTDLGGNAVRPAAPVDVTFTVEPGGGGATATFPNGASSVVVATDANGLASAPRLTAGTRAGSFAVRATAAELDPARFELGVQPGPATRLEVGEVDPVLVSAAHPEVLAVHATLTDAYGNRVVSDTGMEVTTSGDQEVWTVDFIPAQALWRANLVSSAALGRFAVTFRFGMLTGSATFDQALAPLLHAPAVTVAHDSASIALDVDPQGAETTYRVEWGAETAGEQATAAATVPRGVGPVAVTVPLAGIRPSTTYLYRIVAENAIGETETPVRTFTTPASPPPVDRGGDGGGGDRGGDRPGDGRTPGDGDRGGTPPAAAPVLTALRPDARAFAARRGGRGRATVRFGLTAAARVRIVVAVRARGVRAGGRCVAARRGRAGRPCARWVQRGAWTVAGRAGANAVTLRGGALPRGAYRLTATPAGGRPATAAFAIRR